MNKKSYLTARQNIPQKAAFPAIDAHNHLWGHWQVEKIVNVMEQVRVVCYCNVTGNVNIEFSKGSFLIKPADINNFFRNCTDKYPGRFYCFTMAGFAHPENKPLFTNAEKFVDDFIKTLREHIALGAKGLKVLKELGLKYKDQHGNLLNVDDERLFPIWEEAAKLNIPVLIHQADPNGFFEPVTPENEHYESLKKYPYWSFADPKFPRKHELLQRRDKLLKLHPDTTFILPHVANYAENLSYVAGLLDENPNVIIDFSARLDELGRQPYSAREFFIKYQDRIIFGTDMPANLESSADMYRTYFRFLETFDESFYAPDYDGTFERARWPICGIGLPEDVLEKIYYKNIIRIIPSLGKELKQ